MSGSSPQNGVSANGSGVVTDALLNAFVQTCNTAATARGFIGITGMTITLQGLNAAGDGGGGIFYWSVGNYTDDGQNTLVPNGAVGQGAWLRSFESKGPPRYTVAGLPGVTSANHGDEAYATDGRNSGEGSGDGTGCICSVNSNGVWAAVWSGVAVTS
jgi:hypothetical protein